MKALYALPVILAACASPFRDCPREQAICDPKTGRCTCEAPTASRPDLMRERGDRMPVANRPDPQPPTVEPPKPEPEPEPEKPQHPGKEPDKATDPDGWGHWRDAMDKWKAGH